LYVNIFRKRNNFLVIKKGFTLNNGIVDNDFSVDDGFDGLSFFGLSAYV